MKIPTINMKKTGEQITRLRKKAGISVSELQEELGFSIPQSIYKWQQGRSLPTLDNLVILAFLLNVTIDDILVIE